AVRYANTRVPRWLATIPFEFATRNVYSWIRTIAFGTDVAFDPRTASVNVFAASRRPAVSVVAVAASHAPRTSPFPASVGRPEKSGSSGTRFNPPLAPPTADRASAPAASAVARHRTR